MKYIQWHRSKLHIRSRTDVLKTVCGLILPDEMIAPVVGAKVCHTCQARLAAKHEGTINRSKRLEVESVLDSLDEERGESTVPTYEDWDNV